MDNRKSGQAGRRSRLRPSGGYRNLRSFQTATAIYEREFIHEGGYTEQLAAARVQERGRQRGSERGQLGGPDPSGPADRTDQSDGGDKAPDCPTCGERMVLRTARQGKQAGTQFWGYSGYPECKGTRKLEG